MYIYITHITLGNRRSSDGETSDFSDEDDYSLKSGSVSPAPGDTLPWNLPRHERHKRQILGGSVLDPAERAVLRIADERDRVQKKTFTKWINQHLLKVRKHVNDLYEDLRDGHNLISLLEVLTGQSLPREKGRMRFHRLQNVQIALDFLKKRQVKLVNIRNDDITDGNPKLTLGLIWTIILHFQISEIHVCGESEDMTAKERLLMWSQQMTEGYVGVRCDNFTTSWRDGRLFNAIIHKYRPDLVDMARVSVETSRSNLEQAFGVAERLGVARLLDPEDVDVQTPDEKSVITYVSTLYDVFPKVPDGVDGINANDVDIKWVEYQNMVNYLSQWLKHNVAVMSDRAFPNNPVELKALYTQYLQFKENEIPLKETEKGKIKHLYKMLEVWIEFGRIQLPQGYHPNDVEKEWGKLIVAMLEREKSLRPEANVVRLNFLISLLLLNFVIEKYINNSLDIYIFSQDAKRLESGIQFQNEAETAGHLLECENLLRQQVVDIQILLDGKYYYSDQLVQRCKLTAFSRYHKFETNSELFCLPLKVQLDRGDWGSDLPSVETHLENHKGVHRAIEEFQMSLKEAKLSEIQMTQKRSYSEKLGKLETQYGKLLNCSRERQKNLESLHDFVSRATMELIWLNEKEEEEVAFDWSDRNSNISKKREYHSDLMRELDEKEEVIKSVQDMAENLLQENHPARLTIEAYKAAMQTQWSWILQLCSCVEQHLKDNTVYFEFFNDAKESTDYLKSLQGDIQRKYCCDRTSSVHKLEDHIQESMDEKEQLLQYRSTVAGLVGKAKAIVQLKPRNPDTPIRSSIPVKAICDYRQIEITIYKDDECVLASNSHRAKWKVISPSGNEAMVPSVCFTVPPPNKEAVDQASRIEQLYQNVLALWHHSHIKMKSVVSWHYLMADVRAIRDWNTMLPGEHQQVLINLQSHFEDFLEDSKESEVFTVADCSQLEREVLACKDYYEELLKSAEREEHEESVYNLYISEVRNFRMRLEAQEEHLIRQIRTPLDRDDLEQSVLRITEQEKKAELDQLKDDLETMKEKCETFFIQAGASPAVPTLSSDLNVLIQSMSQVYSMSALSLCYIRLQDLEGISKSLKYYKDSYVSLDEWVREMEAAQLKTQEKQPEDSKALAELVNQQKVLVAEMEQKQSRIDECQKYSEQYSSGAKDYELQLLTYRAMVDSQHKSPLKRRRMQNSADAIVQEFMDLRTRYTAVVTSMTQYVKFASETLKRAEGEELTILQEEVETYKSTIEDLTLQRSKAEDGAQQYRLKLETVVKGKAVIEQELGNAREMVQHSEAKRSSLEESLRMLKINIEKLIKTKLLDRETLQKLETGLVTLDEVQASLAQFIGKPTAIAGVYLVSSKKKISFLEAADQGLLAKTYAIEYMEAQAATGCIINPSTGQTLSVQAALESGIVGLNLKDKLMDAEKAATGYVHGSKTLSVYQAMEERIVDRHKGKKIIEAQIATGGLVHPVLGVRVPVNVAVDQSLLNKATLQNLYDPVSNPKGFHNPDSGQKTYYCELLKKCLYDTDGGVYLLPFGEKNLSSFSFSSSHRLSVINSDSEWQENYRSGLISIYELADLILSRMVVVQDANSPVAGLWDVTQKRRVTILQGHQQSLIDRLTALRLLEAQACTGGICDPASGEKAPVTEALRRGLLDETFARQLQQSEQAYYGIIHPQTAKTLSVAQAIQENLFPKDMGLRCLEFQVLTGGLINPETHDRISLDEAIQSCLVDKATASFLKDEKSHPKSLTLIDFPWFVNRETEYLIDKTKLDSIKCILKVGSVDVYSLFSSVQSGMIDHTTGLSLLEAQLITSGLVLPQFRMCLELDEAFHHNLIDEATCKQLRELNEANRSILSPPFSSEPLPVIAALREGAVSERLAMKVIEIQLATGGLRVSYTGDVLTLERAFQFGLIPAPLYVKLLERQNTWKDLINPGTSEKVSLAQLVQRSVVDEETGLRLLPVKKSHNGNIELTSGREMSVLSAVHEGLIDRETTLRLLCAQLFAGGIAEPRTGRKLTVEQSLSEGLIDQDTASGILSQQAQNGGIVNPQNGKRLTVDEAVQCDLMSFSSALLVLEKQKGLMGLLWPHSATQTVLKISTLCSGKDTGLTLASVAQGSPQHPTYPMTPGCETVKDTNFESSLLATVLTDTLDTTTAFPCTEEVVWDNEDERGLAAHFLRSQVEEGGILYIISGKRYDLDAPFDKGLVDEETVLEVSALQLHKGDVLREERSTVATLKEAVSKGSISSQIALQIMEQHSLLGGVHDPKSGCTISVSEALDSEMIDDDLAEKILHSDPVHKAIIHPDRHCTHSISYSQSLVVLIDSFHLHDHLCLWTQRHLEDTAFDIQYFISEHAQFLSPAQSRHLLKSLSATQRAFKEQTERVANQRRTLELHLEIREDESQQKVWTQITILQLGPLHLGKSRFQFVEKTMKIALNEIISSTKKFLDENRSKLTPDQIVAIESKLEDAKSKVKLINQRAEESRKDLEKSVTTAIKQETEKVGKHIAHHQEILSQQQELIMATQSAQALLDHQAHALSPTDKDKLQRNIQELKGRYDASLTQAEQQMKQVVQVQEELKKFQGDCEEFEGWLQQAEGEVEELGAPAGALNDLTEKLQRQKSFSEDVISHKGDLRFITISGQKVLDVAKACGRMDPGGKDAHLEVDTTTTCAAVKEKLDSAAGRFKALHSQCNDLGNNLRDVVDKYKKYEDSTAGLLKWLNNSEEEARRQQSEAIAADPQTLQKQIYSSIVSLFQALEQDIYSRQSSISAMKAKVKKFVETADPTAAALLQSKMDALSQRFSDACDKHKHKQGQLEQLKDKVEEFEKTMEKVQQFVLKRSQALSETDGPGKNVNELSQLMQVASHQICLILSTCFQQNIFSKRIYVHLKRQSAVTCLVSNTLTSNRTELMVVQQNMSYINDGHQSLGELLKGRAAELSVLVQEVTEAQKETDTMITWLQDMKKTSASWNSASTEKDTMKTQLEQQKVDSTKAWGCAKFKLQGCFVLTDVCSSDAAWADVSGSVEDRKQRLEESNRNLDMFQTTEPLLRQWLSEKDMMLSVLGPLSMDPNMLNTQKQQVQILLNEFDSRKPQFDQLHEAAAAILSTSGKQDPSSGGKVVKDQLAAVTQKWQGLTGQLGQRAGLIDQAVGKSGQFQDLLMSLSQSAASLETQLNSQQALSSQPDVVKKQLEEANTISGQLREERKRLKEAETLCSELSALVTEDYLKAGLDRQLEGVNKPFKQLEDKAAKRIQQLNSAFASSQQFHQTSKDFQGWMNEKLQEQSKPQTISAQVENLRQSLKEQSALQKALSEHEKPYSTIVREGETLLQNTDGAEKVAMQGQLAALRSNWDDVKKSSAERQDKLQGALQRAQKYHEQAEKLQSWVQECEVREGSVRLSVDPVEVESSVSQLKAIQKDVDKHRGLVEQLNTAADSLLEVANADTEAIRVEKAAIGQSVDRVTEGVQNKRESLEKISQRLKEFNDTHNEAKGQLAGAKKQLDAHTSLGVQAYSNKNLTNMKAQQKSLDGVNTQVEHLKSLAQGLVADVPEADGVTDLLLQADSLEKEHGSLSKDVGETCSTLEGKLQGIGQFQTNIREMFTHFADLDDELDSMASVGRDLITLKEQQDGIKGFVEKLQELMADTARGGDSCKKMLETEASPDLLGLKRDLDALSKQCGKLMDRAKGRGEEVGSTLTRLDELYSKLQQFTNKLGGAEVKEEGQGSVGMETDVINQQLEAFKVFQKEVDPLQSQLQDINWLGQGLIQNADKGTSTKGLEHDLEDVNTQWNTLNKKIAERSAQLHEALLHCGRFQDALESLLSWLTDTEDLVSNQKPPSAEFKVVKAQIQEQILLQRLLDDRRPTVELIKKEGGKVAELGAESVDKEKVGKEIECLGQRWDALLKKAENRHKQLKSILVVAQQFHETLEPLSEWLSATEKHLAKAEPIGTQTSKLEEQISQHKALHEDIELRKQNVDQAISNGLELLKQTTGDEVVVIQGKLDGIKMRYAEINSMSDNVSKTLDQALTLASKLQHTHEDLSSWLKNVEAELTAFTAQEPVGEQLVQAQDRQKALLKEARDHKPQVDKLNEVSSSLLELVPWRAREGLDKIVTEDNDRYKATSDTIAHHVEQIDAAILKSQQFEQAADSELAWLTDAERKMLSLGEIRLEQDQTTVQLHAQKGFSMDIMRHKDAVDGIVKTGQAIMNSKDEEEKQALKAKIQALLEKYVVVSQLNSERCLQLERAQSLASQFWETYEELWPWLQETRTSFSQLPLASIEYEALRQQQEELRQMRELIAEHKPYIDKMNKTGPQLLELSPVAGVAIREKYTATDQLYAQLKADVKQRAFTLDEAISKSTQVTHFHDKIEPMLESLERIAERLRQPPSISVEVEKIREQITENKVVSADLEKLQPSYDTLKQRGEEMIARSAGADKDISAKAVQDKLDRMVFTWNEIHALMEEREAKLLDVMDLADKFWCDHCALIVTIKDTQDLLRELEEPGVDPSVVKQQQEYLESFKEEIDGLQEELDVVRNLGAELMAACGEPDKPVTKKSIDEVNLAWETLNKAWKERVDRLDEAMQAAVQFQDGLQGMFDWVDIVEHKLGSMSPVGTDLDTVKQQIEELKEFKGEAYQLQMEMERLNHQAGLLLKKVTEEYDRCAIQEPMTELKMLWDNLDEKIINRQHKLEGALLALGQFQHALDELLAWMSNTEELLNEQRKAVGDPKAIEIKLAKHHVLQNDVLAHKTTVEAVNKAGTDLVESTSGEEAAGLQNKLENLTQRWKNILEKTEQRRQQLDSALLQAQGFHGEIEDMQQWLKDTERQLLASKAVGGLPDTAREQLNAHLELCSTMEAKEELYQQLMNKGQQLLTMTPSGQDSNTEQDLRNLQDKWESVQAKVAERKVKLEEALALATEFHNSLQDFINWLTQAEQTLTMSSPASLILETILFQIDEHKVFVTEVNSHRQQIIELDKTGTHLKYFSQKQDVVLIKNLLISVQGRWEKVVQRSVERGRLLDDTRKRAKQFHETWNKLTEWLDDSEKALDSELEIANDPDKIKTQLAQHKEFQKVLGSKHSVYDTTSRTGRALKDKTSLQDDNQKLDDMLSELRDKWDTVCGKSVERQNKLEEALLFSGQFTDALQALIDWLYRVEPQLAEDQPVHGDIDLVLNLIDSHKVNIGNICTIDLHCPAAEQYPWSSTLGAEFMKKQEEKRVGLNKATSMGEAILTICHPDSITTIKHWNTIIKARFEEVQAWARQHQQRLAMALSDLLATKELLEGLLSWLQWAETTLNDKDMEVLPQEIDQVKALIAEHQTFMEEMTRKQPDVDKITKTHKRKAAVGSEPASQSHIPVLEKGRGGRKRSPTQAMYPSSSQPPIETKNPRVNLLVSKWQQVWLLALDRRRKLNDAMDRLEELKEFANFDFDVWRKRYMRWMNHKKSRVMDFFRRIDKDQDGKVTRQEFIEGILSSKFPTSRLEMSAVADIFDRDGDGYIDYYEFVAALHPNKEAYKPLTDADKIEDEVTRQVAKCKCPKRFQVEQIGANKYRFGDSQQLRLVRILRSTVMVRVGGGWMALDEFLVKNDPCRAKGRTNMELREKFILPEGTTQVMASFRYRGRRSRPSSRAASPNRSNSNHSCPPQQNNPGLTSTPKSIPIQGSKLRLPGYLSGKGFQSGEEQGTLINALTGIFCSPESRRPGSRPGSKAGSRGSSRRGSDASDFDISDIASVCSDTSEMVGDTSRATPRSSSRQHGGKPSKIPTPQRRSTPSKLAKTSKR
uniref:Dystonin n=1 Tax=Hucho hucho TaxID=62062 RepID=A0A4W5PXI1_9TELE